MRSNISRVRSSERVHEFLILNSKFLIAPAAAAAAFLLASPLISAQSQTSGTTAELKAKFERRLHDLSAAVDGVVGYEIVDLTSGEKFAHLERETFPTAST